MPAPKKILIPPSAPFCQTKYCHRIACPESTAFTGLVRTFKTAEGGSMRKTTLARLLGGLVLVATLGA
ncbi:hypothetical protein, partial [Burkholderia gladioli]